MRNISFFVLIPIAIFATPQYQEEFIPSDDATIYGENQEMMERSFDQEEQLIPIESKLPLPTASDIIIPPSFQNRLNHVEEVEEVEEEISTSYPIVQEESDSVVEIINNNEASYPPIQSKSLEATSEPLFFTPPPSSSFSDNIESMDGDVPQIQGTYTLDQGRERNTNIDNAMMVIEKLDNDDFGYYYARRIGEHPSTGYLGIFHYDVAKKRFFSKVKETDTKAQTLDNIKIIVEPDRLKTIQDIQYGKRIIIWNKVDDKCIADPDLVKSLNQTRDSYQQIYKNNKNYLID